MTAHEKRMLKTLITAAAAQRKRLAANANQYKIYGLDSPACVSAAKEYDKLTAAIAWAEQRLETNQLTLFSQEGKA